MQSPVILTFVEKKMRPAVYRYMVAHTSTFSMGMGVVIAISLTLLFLHGEGALVPDIGVWLWILVATIPAGLIGLIFGVIVIWQILLSYPAARIQGWPFKVGDEVVILTGRHKNTTRIYEIWEERGQVRVDLGEALKQEVKDVFCAVEVCRKRNSEPAGGAYVSPVASDPSAHP
ncbi:MAG: hypothetical protein GX811_06810 [Lentisphaerae bacterium]|nr:hypothetical protein [Lentisphaerota bacterium]